MAPPKNAVGPYGAAWSQPASCMRQDIPAHLAQPVRYGDHDPDALYGYVYAVECCGAVKVGSSALQPETKLMQLQIGSPHKLHMLGALSHTREDESAIHKLLDPFWIRGEWFALVPECRALIERLLAGDPVEVLLDEQRAA